MLIKPPAKNGGNKGPTRMEVGQINLGKRKSATTELNRRQYDLVLVTEPQTVGGSVTGIEPRSEVISPRGKGTRTCIRTSTNSWGVEDFTEADLTTAALKLDNSIIYFASLYLDINKGVREGRWINLIDWCEREKIPLVIGMDSNAHSPLWGSHELNKRGEDLEEVVMEKNLTVLNRGRMATFRGGLDGTVIDVTLVNSYAIHLVDLSTWEVDPAESMSDHRYISFTLDVNPTAERKAVRNIRKAKWEVFKATLDTLPLGTVYQQVEKPERWLDTQCEELLCNINVALDAACPMKNQARPTTNKWWNKELEKLRQEVRTLEKRRNNPEVRETYLEVRRKYSREISNAKRESWRDFCSKAEAVKDVANLVKCLEPKPPTRLCLFHKGGDLLTPSKSLEHMLKTHFPDSVNAPEEVGDLPALGADFTGIVQWITPQRVTAAIRSFGDYKAAGPDGLQPIVLKNLTKGYIEHLTTIFQYALAHGLVPKPWRKMQVIFIPKVGKSQYADPKAYRPITLSNFILKTLERCVQWFITDHCLKKPLVNQHAYTRGLSTETALSEFIDVVERATFSGNHALAVSLDCSGAFDSVTFDAASRAMHKLKIPDIIIRWYDRILRNRHVWADVQGAKHTITPGRGSPQGGVLSPIVWNMVMNTLLTKLESGPVKAIGYADDIMLVATGPDASISGGLLQKALDTVQEWGTQCGLHFNPDKTAAVLFTRKKGVLNPPLRLQQRSLSFGGTLRYLGITVQKDLKWDQHIEERASRCRYLLQRTRAIIGQHWGLDPQKCLWIHMAIVRPKLCYGSLVWANNLSGGAKKTMRKVQRLALLAATHPLRSTPSKGMEVALGVIPLDLHAEREATKARMRTRPLLKDKWDGLGITRKKGHRRHWDDILRKVIPPDHTTDHMPARLNWFQDTVVTLPDVTIYTDGSAGENKSGGYGWAACRGPHVIEEGSGGLSNATAFQAEIFALKEAATWVALQDKDYNSFNIISDSRSALCAVQSTMISSTTVWAAAEMLRQAAEKKPLQLEWTKGHSNCTGNEFSDFLAKKGRGANTKTRLPWSSQSIKGEIHKLFLKKWQRQWNTEPTCRNTRAILPTVDERRFRVGRITRQKLNLICQAVTGHGLFAGHLSKWRSIEEKCKLCEEEAETSAHLWLRCPALEVRRRAIQEDISGVALLGEIYNFFTSDQIAELMVSNEDQLTT